VSRADDAASEEEDRVQVNYEGGGLAGNNTEQEVDDRQHSRSYPTSKGGISRPRAFEKWIV